jgi:NAD(P)-dependent dehydrogenase (short-subunit alcohol dehydrogenase family)
MAHTSKNEERVILITGASSGFGYACALHLIQRGYRVYGTSRGAKYEQRTGKHDVEGLYHKMIPMDVRDQISVEKGINHILKHEGRIDIAVNNAGFGIAGSVEDTSIEEAKNQFDTNFFGVWRVCRAVLPHMRKQGFGYIINISSLAGLIGIPFQGAYSATKFALEGFTEVLRMEVKRFGIKVVLIEPGDFNTGFTQNRKKTVGAQKSKIYSDQFHPALSVMEKDEMNGLSPDKVALLLEKIINQPKPKLRYTSGKLEQRIAPFVKKVLPASLFEGAIMNNYKIKG